MASNDMQHPKSKELKKLVVCVENMNEKFLTSRQCLTTLNCLNGLEIRKLNYRMGKSEHSWTVFVMTFSTKTANLE